MWNILVCVKDFELLCQQAYQKLLDAGYNIILNKKGYPYDFHYYRIELKKADAVIAGIEEWTKEHIDMAPHLKVISRFGTGINNIDCNYAKSKGIAIMRAESGNTNAVAEQTIALIYSVLKKYHILIKKQKQAIGSGLFVMS